MKKRIANTLETGSGNSRGRRGTAAEHRTEPAWHPPRLGNPGFASALLLAACANLTAPSALAQVSVAISPSSLMTATNATEVLTATVSGTSNTAVTWEVNGVQGGSSSTGVVSTTIPGTTGEALYLAPASIPTGGSVTLTAVSQADPSKSASALLTIQAPSRSGVTYYVSTTGKDSNPGTLAAPFLTIQHAANTAAAGDAVQVRAGSTTRKSPFPVPATRLRDTSVT